MEDYNEQVSRAWRSLMNDLMRDISILDAISKVRGSYGFAIANTITDMVSKSLLSLDSKEVA